MFIKFLIVGNVRVIFKSLCFNQFRETALQYSQYFFQFSRKYFNTRGYISNFLRFISDPEDPSELTPSFCPFLLETRRLLGLVCSSISADSAVTLFFMLNEVIANVLCEMVASVRVKLVSVSEIDCDIVTTNL